MRKLSKKDIQGIKIILCCGLVFLSLTIMYFYLSGRQQVDFDTLCLLDSPLAGHTAILIDRTDPLNGKQTFWLKKEILRTKVDLKTNEKLSIFLITDASDSFLRPIFSLCSPGSGKHANPLYENPKRIREKFEESFGKPLEIALDALTQGTSYQESAIMETIKTLADEREFSQKINSRKIIIVSDMLQNVKAFSHYKNNTFRDLVGTEYYQKIKPNLNSVPIKIYYVANNYPNARKLQGTTHMKFWKNFFMRAGAKQIEFDKIGYLSLKQKTRSKKERLAIAIPKQKKSIPEDFKSLKIERVAEKKKKRPQKRNAKDDLALKGLVYEPLSKKATFLQSRGKPKKTSGLLKEMYELEELNKQAHAALDKPKIKHADPKANELVRRLESIKKESVQTAIDINKLPPRHSTKFKTEIHKKYVRKIYEKILDNWKDPLGGGNGIVQVSFYIFPRGNIMMPKVLKSSGSSKLDNLAIRAIKNAAPLPPFPKEIKEPKLSLIFNFSYISSKG